MSPRKSAGAGGELKSANFGLGMNVPSVPSTAGCLFEKVRQANTPKLYISAAVLVCLFDMTCNSRVATCVMSAWADILRMKTALAVY